MLALKLTGDKLSCYAAFLLNLTWTNSDAVWMSGHPVFFWNNWAILAIFFLWKWL